VGQRVLVTPSLGFPGTRGFAGAFIYEGSHPFERGASSLSRFPGGGPAQRPCSPSTQVLSVEDAVHQLVHQPARNNGEQRLTLQR
jgi:hypothetical protein